MTKKPRYSSGGGLSKTAKTPAFRFEKNRATFRAKKRTKNVFEEKTAGIAMRGGTRSTNKTPACWSRHSAMPYTRVSIGRILRIFIAMTRTHRYIHSIVTLAYRTTPCNTVLSRRSSKHYFNVVSRSANAAEYGLCTAHRSTFYRVKCI